MSRVGECGVSEKKKKKKEARVRGGVPTRGEGNGSIVCLTMAFAIGLGPYPGLTAPNALPGG